MATVNKNERFVPVKNYVIVFLVAIGVIALVLYAFEWRNAIQKDRVSTSYLVKQKVISNEMKTLEELNDVFSEAPSEYFLYISYTGSEKIYKLEQELKVLIENYNLSEEFYYLNVTNIKNGEGYMDEINKVLNLEDRKITSIPTIVYFVDGKAVDMVERKDNNMMNSGDFEHMLEANRIEKGR